MNSTSQNYTQHPLKRDSLLWSGLLARQINEAVQNSNLSPSQLEYFGILDKYKRFTPATVHKQLSNKLSANSQLEPHSVSVYASVLLADISGFTRLSSRLSAEELKHHINEYFSTLLGIVKKSGGDVIKFLGDAVLIIFPIDEENCNEIKAAAVLMASLCAIKLVKECGDYRRGEGENEVKLSLHCGIGCGLVHCMCMGEGERWEFLISGQPLFQVGKAMNDAQVGEVCLSEESMRHVEEHLETKKTAGGNYLLTGRFTCSWFCNNLNITSAAGTPDSRNKSNKRNSNSNSSNTGNNAQFIRPVFDRNSSSLSLRNVFGNGMYDPATGIPNNDVDVDNSNSNLPTPNTTPLLKKRSSLTYNNNTDDAPVAYSQNSANNPSMLSARNRSTSLHYRQQSIKEEPTAVEIKEQETINSSGSSGGEIILRNNPDSSLLGNFNKTIMTHGVSDSIGNTNFEASEDWDNAGSGGVAAGAITSTATSSLTRISAVFVGLLHLTAMQSPGAMRESEGSRSRKRVYSMDFSNHGTSRRNSMAVSGRNTASSHRKGSSIFGSTHSSVGGGGGSVTSVAPLVCNQTSVNSMINSTILVSSSHGGQSRSSSICSPTQQSQSSQQQSPQQVVVKGNKRKGTCVIRSGCDQPVDPLSLIQDHPTVRAVRSFLWGFLDPEYDEKVRTREPFSPHISSNQRMLTSALKYFVHDAARSALESDGGAYLFELRNVTTLFIELLGLEEDLSQGFVTRPQTAMSICLGSLNRFGGSLRQYTVDDKGCVLIGAFGLPGSSHEDNSRRAVEAALSISLSLAAAGIGSKSGVAEGRVYCGLVGSTERCEYAMMGSSVNLAARLMSGCQAAGEVLVSESVFLASQNAFVFTALPKIKAKGYSSSVAVYRPTERAYGNTFLSFKATSDNSFVGREKELKIVVEAILRIKRKTVSEVFLVDGPPNIGKTRLVVEALREANNRTASFQPPEEVRVMVGTASAAYITLQYYVLRQLLEQMIGIKLNRSKLDDDAGIDNLQTDTKCKRVSLKEDAATECVHLSAIMSWLASLSLPVCLDLKSIPKLPDFRSSNCNGGVGVSGDQQYANIFPRPVRDRDRDREGHGSGSGSNTPLRKQISGRYNYLEIISISPIEKQKSEHIHGVMTSSNNMSNRNSVVGCDLVQDLTFDFVDNGNYNKPTPCSVPKHSQQLHRVPMLRNFSLEQDDDDGKDDDYLLVDLVPLLGDVLGTKIQDNSITSQLTGAKRKRCTEALLHRLLVAAMTATASSSSSCFDVIFVDNLQWCDWMSLRSLTRLIKHLPRGILIATTRSVDEIHLMGVGGTAAERLKRQRVIQIIENLSRSIAPQPFSFEETKIIIERTIGPQLLQSNPSVLSSFNIAMILERSSGSPFHATVLATGLRNALISRKFTGVEDLAAGLSDNLIVSRFDQLSKPNQIVIKAASVIGMIFSELVLSHIIKELNLLAGDKKLEDCMASLLDSNLITTFYDSPATSSSSLTQTGNTGCSGNSNYVSSAHKSNSQKLRSSRTNKKYKFADRTTIDSIYNLMLASQRERFHGVIGSYYEKLYVESHVDLFDEIMHHFILSNNTNKKIEYLLQATSQSTSDHSPSNAYSHYNKLLIIITGQTMEKVIQQICRQETKKYNYFSSFPKLHIVSSIISCYYRLYNIIGRFLPFTLPAKKERKRKSKVRRSIISKSKEEATTPDLKSKVWLTWADLTHKTKITLDNNLNSDSFTFTSTTISAWIVHMGRAQLMLGNLREASNLIHLGIHNLLLSASTSASSILKTAAATSVARATASSAKLHLELCLSNKSDCTVFLQALQQLLFIYLLRGYPEQALEISKLIAKLVDLDEDSESPSEEVTKMRIGSKALASIAMMSSSRSEKEREKALDLFDEAQAAIKSQSDSLQPDVTLLLALATHATSISQWINAIEYLQIAAQQALSQGDRVQQHHALMGKAWCCFVAGRVPAARLALDALLRFAASESLVPLHVWGLELDILMKTFTNDHEGAEEALRVIRTLRMRNYNDYYETMNDASIESKHDDLSASTSAIVAFHLVCNRQYERARPLAARACSQLTSRKQGLALGGVVLFCGVYALLDVVEYFKTMYKIKHSLNEDSIRERSVRAIGSKRNSYRLSGKAAVADGTGSVKQQSLAVGMSARRDVTMSGPGHIHSAVSNTTFPSNAKAPTTLVPVSVPVANSATPAVTSRKRNSVRWSEFAAQAAEEKADLRRQVESAKHAIESLMEMSRRFPCLLPLVWTVANRYKRLENSDFSSLAELLTELDAEIEENYSYMTEFTFAEAFVHFQRVSLCSTLGMPATFLNSNNSKRIAKFSFSELGGFPGGILEAMTSHTKATSTTAAAAARKVGGWSSVDNEDETEDVNQWYSEEDLSYFDDDGDDDGDSLVSSGSSDDSSSQLPPPDHLHLSSIPGPKIGLALSGKEKETAKYEEEGDDKYVESCKSSSSCSSRGGRSTGGWAVK